MSANIRLQLSYGAGQAVIGRAPRDEDVFMSLASEGEYWHGTYGGGYKPCYVVKVRLPGQIAPAHRLLYRAIHTYSSNGTVANSVRTFWNKLLLCLGLPYPFPDTGMGPDRNERGFLAAIEEDPADLASWHVYADWLRERGWRRGHVIAGWLDPKRPMKLRNGVPEIARGGEHA